MGGNTCTSGLCSMLSFLCLYLLNNKYVWFNCFLVLFVIEKNHILIESYKINVYFLSVSKQIYAEPVTNLEIFPSCIIVVE